MLGGLHTYGVAIRNFLELADHDARVPAAVLQRPSAIQARPLARWSVEFFTIQ